MTIPLWTLLVAVLLPFIWFVPSVEGRKEQFGNADNAHPRLQSAKLEGKGARAYAAHQNAFEAAIVYTPAVLVAHLAHANPLYSTILSCVWVVCRVLHGILYLNNIDKARSAAFAFGQLCVLGQFIISGMAGTTLP